jgi:hypothetical protein
VTQLSYLKHVEARTDAELIGAEIQEYLERVTEAMPDDSDPLSTIDTHLFYGRLTSPEEEGSSLDQIRHGMAEGLEDHPGYQEFLGRITATQTGWAQDDDRDGNSGDNDYVVVGGAEPPGLLQVAQPEFEAALATIRKGEVQTDLDVPVAMLLRRLARTAAAIRRVIPQPAIRAAYEQAGTYNLDIQGALLPFLD